MRDERRSWDPRTNVPLCETCQAVWGSTSPSPWHHFSVLKRACHTNLWAKLRTLTSGPVQVLEPLEPWKIPHTSSWKPSIRQQEPRQ